MPRRSIAAAAAAACTAVLTVGTTASANGRFPASNQIVFSPVTPSAVIVRTTFGVLFTTDGEKTWRWLCEDTLGLSSTSNEDPYYVVSANGTLIAGLSLGLQTSTSSGCDWTVAGGALAGQLVKDLDPHVSDMHTVDLITSTHTASAGPDGGPGYVQQTFETTDDGAHWTAFGTPIDPTAIVTTIDIAPSDPNRLYVSAFRITSMGNTASLFVSSDKGTTWTEHPVALDATESAVYIGAVDPNDENVVYLRSEGQSRLMVSRDGGQTIQAVKTLDDEMLGLALSADGSKIYIGSVADGLLVAPTSTLSFTQTSSIHVQCLATRGTELWACSDEASGFVAGISQDDGKTFTPVLHLLDIAGPIECPASAAASMCTAWDLEAGAFYNPFVGICSNLGACIGTAPSPLANTCNCTGACVASNTSNAAAFDASVTCDGGVVGAPEGGSIGDAGSPPGSTPPAKSSSGGCSMVGGRAAVGTFAAGGALALGALFAGRRRARRPRR